MENLINKYYFSWFSTFIHTVWFVIWFVMQLSVDVLTNVVSLEAIYICIFLGISQRDHHETTRQVVIDTAATTEED